MKCSILGLCLFLSLFFWPVPFIMWPFDLGVLLFKTLIRVHNPFCALHLISHYMLSWRCVKASSGNKTAHVWFLYVLICMFPYVFMPDFIPLIFVIPGVFFIVVLGFEWFWLNRVICVMSSIWTTCWFKNILSQPYSRLIWNDETTGLKRKVKDRAVH